MDISSDIVTAYLDMYCQEVRRIACASESQFPASTSLVCAADELGFVFGQEEMPRANNNSGGEECCFIESLLRMCPMVAFVRIFIALPLG
mmetsp:Transcript_115436/g.172469  ORF Transcript_115436/g.172469 Transcript_115436/m.172469 type:complete len:90 (-) Transcript_115436:264-533(-)